MPASPSAPAAEAPAAEVEPPVADATNDDPGFQVFRRWADLPPELQQQASPALFPRHIVVRVEVPLGCVSPGTPRKGGRMLWPEYAVQCMRGRGTVHPLRIVRSEPSKLLPYSPPIDIHVTGDHTSIGLAPPVVPDCPITIVDTHWFVVPNGRVTLGMTEGSDRCEEQP